MQPTLRAAHGLPLAPQRGAATLIVVMVLFFVMSLVAAYSSRNIIFEQKIAVNQHHGLVSFEAAEAGLDWAVAMLNGPLIDAQCVPTLDRGLNSFRQRYLVTNFNSGEITVDAAVRDGVRRPTCVFGGGDWTCSCPSGNNAPVVAAPAAPGLAPAFRVRFLPLGPTYPSIVRIEVNGCTTLDDACLNFRAANIDECGGTVCTSVALQPGVKSAPVAALTARSSINLGAETLSVYNTAPGTSGLTIVAGGAVNRGFLDLHGAPGTPVARTVVENDASLAAAAFDANRMFASVFGVWPLTYWEQPGAVRLDCAPTCVASDVRDAVAINPGRVVLVNGNLDLDGGGDIGADAVPPAAGNPVVLVVTGDLTFSAPTNVYGLVYVRNAAWATRGIGQIKGAVVAEEAVSSSGAGAFTAVYDAGLLNTLRWSTGSFVAVPGTWKDFR